MKHVLAFVFACALLPAVAQRTDSVVQIHFDNTFKRVYKAPLILIGAGLFAATDNEVFDKWEINELRNKVTPNFHTTTDNYLQYVPIAMCYALPAFQITPKHDVINRTALLIKSELLMSVLVFSLKHITQVDRPGTESDTSFPSGHTAQAFVAATFLHKEYGEKYPLISILGYTTASTVGILRIMNEKHWASDVLVGAGIGILSTNLVYETHRFKWAKRPNALNHVRIMPAYQRGSMGFSLTLSAR